MNKTVCSVRLSEIQDPKALEYISSIKELVKEISGDLQSSVRYSIDIEAENSRLRARLKSYEKAMSDIGATAKVEEKIYQNESMGLTNVSESDVWKEHRRQESKE